MLHKDQEFVAPMLIFTSDAATFGLQYNNGQHADVSRYALANSLVSLRAQARSIYAVS